MNKWWLGIDPDEADIFRALKTLYDSEQELKFNYQDLYAMSAKRSVDESSNSVLDKAMKWIDIYGVTTGFGATSHRRRTQQDIVLQSDLIRFQKAGVLVKDNLGPPLHQVDPQEIKTFLQDQTRQAACRMENLFGTRCGSPNRFSTHNKNKEIENVDTKAEAEPAVNQDIALNTLDAKVDEDVLLEAFKATVTKVDSMGQPFVSGEEPEWPQDSGWMNGTESEDEGLSTRVSSETHESQAEVTADSPYHESNAKYAGRKRPSDTLDKDEDDLITKIAPLVKQQIEDALNSTLLPLVFVLRSREENEQKHREKLLALENAKLAMKREKLLFKRRRVAQSPPSSHPTSVSASPGHEKQQGLRVESPAR